MDVENRIAERVADLIAKHINLSLTRRGSSAYVDGVIDLNEARCRRSAKINLIKQHLASGIIASGESADLYRAGSLNDKA